MAKLTTTLARIKAHNPCASGFKTLLEHLGHDYPEDKEIDLLTILEVTGVNALFLAIRTVGDKELAKRVAVELAIKFAEWALPVFEKAFPEDDRPRKAIDAAKNWVKTGVQQECHYEEWKNARDATIEASEALRKVVGDKVKYSQLYEKWLEAMAVANAQEAAWYVFLTTQAPTIENAAWMSSISLDNAIFSQIKLDKIERNKKQIEIIKEVLA